MSDETPKPVPGANLVYILTMYFCFPLFTDGMDRNEQGREAEGKGCGRSPRKSGMHR